MSSLALDDVKVHFGGVKAVDGVSFTLEPGRLYGIVGPNGSGKTTLVNAISGVTKVTAGAIRFEDNDITGVGPARVSRAGISRTFQNIKLLPSLTVRENVMVAVDWHRADGADRPTPRAWQWRAKRAESRRVREAADELLERLGLVEVADAEPDALPYGTQRRVEIARALAAQPRLLLLDEPLAGMNRQERNEISSLVTDLRDGGLTILMIEHDLRTLIRICDHFLIMNFGRLIAEGEPRATAALPEVREAYLGSQHAAA
jgi:ABC-type branched-subunit amino acid transport system ATPase component